MRNHNDLSLPRGGSFGQEKVDAFVNLALLGILLEAIMTQDREQQSRKNGNQRKPKAKDIKKEIERIKAVMGNKEL
jgi:hypothetical protein